MLAIISFYYMPTNYAIASVCYVTSALLDAIDGHAARYLFCFRFVSIVRSIRFVGISIRAPNLGLFWISSLTGAERCVCARFCARSTRNTCFCCCYRWRLTSPVTGFICTGIGTKFELDSTFFQRKMCFSTILQGKTSHKFVDMSGNPVMRLYYTNRTVLFWMCCGNEAFYAALYLLHFTGGPLSKQNVFESKSLVNTVFVCSSRFFVVQNRPVRFGTGRSGQNSYLPAALCRSEQESRDYWRERTKSPIGKVQMSIPGFDSRKAILNSVKVLLNHLIFFQLNTLRVAAPPVIQLDVISPKIRLG